MCRIVGWVHKEKEPLFFVEALCLTRYLAREGKLPPKAQEPPEGELRHGDGIGYAIYTGKDFRIDRRGKDEWYDPQFWMQAMDLRGYAGIFHTRRATDKSKVGRDHAHPIVLKDDQGVFLAVVHNGSVRYGDLHDNQTDTQRWIEEVLGNSVQREQVADPNAILRRITQWVQGSGISFTSLTSLWLTEHWLLALRYLPNDAPEDYSNYYTLYYAEEKHACKIASEVPPWEEERKIWKPLSNREYCLIQWTEPGKDIQCQTGQLP